LTLRHEAADHPPIEPMKTQAPPSLQPAVPGVASRERTAFIAVDGVSKSFGTRDGSTTLAVDGVDIEIGASEFVSLLGPSGCGKSTILSIIAGLIQASSGEVRIAGQAIRSPYTNIGIVFQNDLLLDWRTVLGNVLIQFEMRGMNPEPHKARARALIASVGLGDFEGKYPWELSGGMRQRVAICRALIHEPPLLLMDEPFGALDALTRAQLQIDLQSIWQSSRKTVVFVTHSIEEAVFLSDRVIVMTPRPGRVREVIAIDLPRPRRLDARDSPVFADAIRRVNYLFEDMGVIRG
jgi:NitT/TauT family transport system ATP-binding protein